ncbi:hypothetical protein MANES_11G135800v8 [Manihot esculenta]|uniref:Uncharacterized protein n=1 Tax=Manihot esculenta TaxID=3983 RepID=A0ACB7GX39_MANES|nr:hypothetical protein MANES_11G135800v8 [Manihot esculenta]
MKRMDFFCSSPASTAICSSLDHRSMVRSGTTRPIDYRRSKSYAPCSSHHLPFNPKPYYEKNRKSSANEQDDLRRKSSGDISDLRRPTASSSRSSSPADRILEPQQATKSKHSSSVDHSPALKSSSSARSRDQVVVLWVSIHCKGCEGKVRKHISKMEGVTSFSIDLATKKVTVIGNVTPLGVLASVSKVKYAQLWPSPATPSSHVSSTR